MKTTFPFRIAIIIIVAFAGFVFSCKKDNSNKNNENTSSLQTQADDQTMVSDENDNLTNDINTALTSQPATNGNSNKPAIISGSTGVNSATRVNGPGSVNNVLICDATVAFDTVSAPRTVTITYNGTNCWGNRTRTGSVVISIAADVHWRDVGASVSVHVQDLKITRVRDSKSITLNGYKTVTNISGGSLKDLSSLGSITHTISDSFAVLFSDSTTKNWQAAKKRVFTYDNGIVITTTGNHSDNFHTGIAEWGTNRFGVNFTVLISQPIVIRQDCDFRLVSGQATILGSDDVNATITFGLDVSGSPTSCPGGGNYYLEVVWIAANGKSYPIILPY
ncbi:MAG TPA: hypothetical protein VK543_00930 [Puia sp.]|nr:hypothetical protein [Puia sp.]